MRDSVPEANNPTVAPGALARVWRALSPLLVLAVLAAVGVWGFRSGWRLSDKSVDSTATTDVDAPRRVSTASTGGWCDVHGVHICPLCRPEVAELAKPPDVTAADRDRAKRALAVHVRAENRRDVRWHEFQIDFQIGRAH